MGMTYCLGAEGIFSKDVLLWDLGGNVKKMISRVFGKYQLVGIKGSSA